MSFKIQFGDVTKFKGDAILNSLARHGSNHGRVCDAIIKAAKDDSITKAIDSNVGIVGDYFITSGGAMPTKNIIHMITPKRWEESSPSNIENLIDAYRKAIKIAIDNGYETLGIPFVGTGGNKYSPDETYSAVVRACAELEQMEDEAGKELLSVTVFAYLKKTSDLETSFMNERERNFNMNMEMEDCCMAYNGRKTQKYSYYAIDEDHIFDEKMQRELSEEEKTNIKNDIVYRMASFMGGMRYTSFVKINSDWIGHPYDFIKACMKTHNIDNNDLTVCGINSAMRSAYSRSSTTTLNKHVIYRFAFVLQLTKTELIELMCLCGYSFSPASKLDEFFFRFIVGDFRDRYYNVPWSLYQLDQLALDVGYDWSKESKNEIHFVPTNNY